MTVITIKCGDFETEKVFPQTKKGDADSIKWLTATYDTLRSEDSFFFKHKEYIAAKNSAAWTYYGRSVAVKKEHDIRQKRNRLFEVDPPRKKQHLFKVQITHT